MRPDPVGLHRGGQDGEQAGLCDEIRVHDGRGMCRILLGAGLVAENAERQHRGTDRAVIGDDGVDEGTVRLQGVGIELAHRDGGGTGGGHRGDLLVEIIGAAGGQHHRRARRQPRRQLEPDLAASAEDHNAAGIRVLHGSDYRLR